MLLTEWNRFTIGHKKRGHHLAHVVVLRLPKKRSRGQVFDRQNNDFGWAHLPKSFMNQNTVFLLITAMAANFYRYIVALPLMAVLFGIFVDA